MYHYTKYRSAAVADIVCTLGWNRWYFGVSIVPLTLFHLHLYLTSLHRDNDLTWRKLLACAILRTKFYTKLRTIPKFDLNSEYRIYFIIRLIYFCKNINDSTNLLKLDNKVSCMRQFWVLL